MNNALLGLLPKYIIIPEFSGDIREDCISLLNANNKEQIAEHVVKVAETCGEIGKKYFLDESICIISGYLHDIGGIINPNDMINFFKSLGFVIYDAEEKYPFLLHQRLSAILAEELFKIKNKRILSAISCHTTLKMEATKYDMALFVADKISWDKKGTPPFYNVMVEELECSLEKACICYINYIAENKMLLYPHKWFEEAQKYLIDSELIKGD